MSFEQQARTNSMSYGLNNDFKRISRATVVLIKYDNVIVMSAEKNQMISKAYSRYV